MEKAPKAVSRVNTLLTALLRCFHVHRQPLKWKLKRASRLRAPPKRLRQRLCQQAEDGEQGFTGIARTGSFLICSRLRQWGVELGRAVGHHLPQVYVQLVPRT